MHHHLCGQRRMSALAPRYGDAIHALMALTYTGRMRGTHKLARKHEATSYVLGHSLAIAGQSLFLARFTGQFTVQCTVRQVISCAKVIFVREHNILCVTFKNPCNTTFTDHANTLFIL